MESSKRLVVTKMVSRFAVAAYEAEEQMQIELEIGIPYHMDTVGRMCSNGMEPDL